MAWEMRGNNRYYYRKKKVGGKVVSEYVGRGLVAQEIASMDLVGRQERNRELGVIKKERYELGLLDRQVMHSISVMNRLVGVLLIMSGFHKHKGQWRKERNGKN
jgi:hypothetical protein